MSKLITLSKNREFNRVYNRGKSFTSASLVIYVLKNRCNYNKIGITTSKKIGNAVKRNRARRVIREAYRNLSFVIKNGFSIVFVARKKSTVAKCNVVSLDMKNLLKSADLLTEFEK